jgi:serine/threonine protein phosphatase PrpC
MKTRGWAATDVGLKRDHNEDSYLCNPELGLFAVADGMGGHLGGERASRLAVEILEREMTAKLPAATPGEGVAAAMREATRLAAQTIYDEAQRRPELSGMGTTLTATHFGGEQLVVCHVGDSRAYLYRDGKARQLTEDHSWVQQQIRAGLIAPEDAIVSRFRNVITRSVGFEPQVEPDLLTVPLELGDVVLLCSDGLSNYLDEAEIARELTEQFYGEAGQALIDLANERGGDDNITCVLIYTGNQGSAAPEKPPG